ncbi:MAG: L-lactate dehydrogenase [Bryobacteraceae bacterium]
MKNVTAKNAKNSPSRASCVAIIGCGNVGTACAYALLLDPLVRELVLIDQDVSKAEGEAMDLQHAVPVGAPVTVTAGSYKQVAESAIVILTAGAASKSGESRLDLLEENVAITRECIERLMAEHFNGVLLITSNPVDILAQIAQRESGLPMSQVVGSGTVIDTARLRVLLGTALGVEARAVHAYVIGEHGDSAVAAWSAAHIAGIPLSSYPGAAELPPYDELLASVRQAAQEVVARKGNTCFAIASCVTRICKAILGDEHTVLAVSTLMEGQYGLQDIYLSTPCVVGASGVERVLELPLNEKEQSGLHASANVLRSALQGCRRSRVHSPR